MNFHYSPPDFNNMSEREILVWLATVQGAMCAEMSDFDGRLRTVEKNWWTSGMITKVLGTIGGFLGGATLG
jgi:hypothetical protein